MSSNIITGDWHRSQYICSSEDLDVFDNWNKLIFFDDFFIYSHKSLSVTSHQNSNGNKAVIIGYLIDPFQPGRKEIDLVKDITSCNNQSSLTKQLQQYTGRYVVIFQNNSTYTVNTDACAFRQVFYGKFNKKTIITSNPKLFLDAFNQSLIINDDKKELLLNEKFIKWESPWFGETSYDDRFTHLLPNKYLDLNLFSSKRVEVFHPSFTNRQELLEYSAEVVRGGIKGFLERNKNVIQAITAGWDSRIALASVKDFREEIKFFILDLQDKPIHKKADQYIPRSLTKKLNIPLWTDVTPQFTQKFKEMFKKNHIFPRWDTKIRNIQWHYQHTKGWINVNTNGLEVARVVYNKKPDEANPFFYADSFHLPHTPFVLDEMEKWHVDALEYSKEIGVSIFDLFFWEQRQGNWGALNANEKDVAVEDLTPFNNKNLLLAWLQVPIKERQYMHYAFFKKLIKHVWAEVLCEPINPEPFKTYLKYYAGVLPRRFLFGK